MESKMTIPEGYTAIVEDSSGTLWAVRADAAYDHAWLGERLRQRGKVRRIELVRRAGCRVIAGAI